MKRSFNIFVLLAVGFLAACGSSTNPNSTPQYVASGPTTGTSTAVPITPAVTTASVSH